MLPKLGLFYKLWGDERNGGEMGRIGMPGVRGVTGGRERIIAKLII